jgi:diguanylate cyclase (GGDEF)-like protein/PAS domain S-box-containing protein
MDLKTVMLMLAVGSFSLGLLLVLFKFSLGKPRLAPFWVEAKMMQAVGSFLLYLRTDIFDCVTAQANAALLLGCAYEAWAVRELSGLKVRRRLHLLSSVAITALSFVFAFLREPYRTGAYFLGHSALYFLPTVFLLRNPSKRRFSLRMTLGIVYCIGSALFLAVSLVCFAMPEYAVTVGRRSLFAMIPGTSFCLFLFSGFILLMLAKERSDMQVHRFQHIVEIANEGVIIFDEHYNISYANKNMAKLLGYTIDELLGMHGSSLFPPEMLDLFWEQEALRKRGEDSVYESRFMTKSGKRHWFLVSAKAIVDENGEFEGSFAVLTDINERKEAELQLVESNRLLTELTYQDGLTGIGNRRCFDATLEREYQRLSRTGATLSVILMDIDHFKEYNDYYGHVKGDECLRQVGSAIAGSIRRSGDLAARYGGDEFACILPDTELEAAVKTAERIKRRIAELKIEHKASKVTGYVTLSLGVAAMRCSPQRLPSEVVAAADKLLYKAKLVRDKIEYGEVAESGLQHVIHK